MRTPIIQPTYLPANGEPAHAPGVYTVDCAGLARPEIEERMRETYDRVGLVKLENTGADTPDKMRDLAEILLSDGIMDAYEGGANSRGQIAMNVFDTGAPKEAHLHYHHEMAYVEESTRALGFMALAQTSASVGATYVSDAVGSTDALMATELGRKLKEKGITYIRCLTDRETGECDDPSNTMSGVYNHWQTSFGVDTVEEVERAAAQKGLEFEWGGANGRFLKTKFTTSAFEYFPQLGKNLLYSSVADDSLWFDAWPGVKDLPTMGAFADATETERPLKITYGDGEDFTREELQLYVDVYDMFGVPIYWRTGDVAVVCNHRWAHGRPSYTLGAEEERTLGVVLGPMYKRLGQYDDEW